MGVLDKLILGTAALSGQPYGRAGWVVSREDAVAVIGRAYALGIRSFDTSPAYGHAEEALSAVVDGSCTVMTKHPKSSVAEVCRSLHLLSPATVHIMSHSLSAKTLNDPKGWESVPLWMSGFSAYMADYQQPQPWHTGLIKQYDCNILNRDACKYGPFIARSVFAQGALVWQPVNPAVDAMVEQASELAASLRLTLPELAIQWALEQDSISGIVIGPSSVKELEEIVGWAKRDCQHIGRLINVLPSDCRVMDCRTWT